MAVDFRANVVQPYSNFTSENWRNGFIVDQGNATYNNTLRCKIVGPNNADWTSRIPNGYRFLYNAVGYDSNAKIQWALVFVLYSQSSYSPVRNRLCIQPYLNVYGDTASKYYGLERASGNAYVQEAPRQRRGNGSGTLYGNDQIVEMYNPQNTSPYCQITCCGEIPYDEVQTNKCINIEYSRISAGMVQNTIALSAWYKQNYGANLTYYANSYVNLYRNTDTTYSGSCNLQAQTLTAPSIVSYHQENVVATTDNDCFAIWKEQQNWSKGSATLSMVDDPYITNGNLTAQSNYWVNSQLTSSCNRFYKESLIPVQYVPQNVVISSSVDSEGVIRLLIKKHTPEGSNGYLDRLTFNDGTNNYQLSGTYYSQDTTIQIARNNAGKLIINGDQTDLGDVSAFTLTIYCDCSKKPNSHGTSYTLEFAAGAVLSAVYLDYPYSQDSESSYINCIGTSPTSDFCFNVITASSIPDDYVISVKVDDVDYGTTFIKNKIKLKNIDLIDQSVIKEEIEFKFALHQSGTAPSDWVSCVAKIVPTGIADVNINDEIEHKNLTRIINNAKSAVLNCSRISDGWSNAYKELSELSQNAGMVSQEIYGTIVNVLSEIYLGIRQGDYQYEISHDQTRNPTYENPLKDTSITGFATDIFEIVDDEDEGIHIHILRISEQSDFEHLSYGQCQLVNQGVEDHSLVLNNFKKDLIIADEVQFQVDQEDGTKVMIVMNNYQKAILYIIKNIFL